MRFLKKYGLFWTSYPLSFQSHCFVTLPWNLFFFLNLILTVFGLYDLLVYIWSYMCKGDWWYYSFTPHLGKCPALNKYCFNEWSNYSYGKKMINPILSWLLLVTMRWCYNKLIGRSLEPSGSNPLIMAGHKTKIRKGCDRCKTDPSMQTHVRPRPLLTASLPPLLFRSWISAMSLCSSWHVYLYSS